METRMRHRRDGFLRYEKKVDGEWESFGECRCGKEDVKLYHFGYLLWFKECYEEITDIPKYNQDPDSLFEKHF